MILLGAGSSASLGIPTMKGFVSVFEEEIKGDRKLEPLYEHIKGSIMNSQQFIDVPISFDLESLMALLEDVSGGGKKRTVSLPTLAFVLSQLNKGKLKGPTIKEAKETFGRFTEKMLKKLRYTIFNVCMKPIFEGEEKGNFATLAKFYGPLFTLLGNGDAISSWNEWIFTTNWDPCLKTWMDYIPFPFEDGTIQDPQKKPVLDPTKGWKANISKVFHIVPLHGSLDLITIKRLRAGGDYEEIYKVIGSHVYFERKPDEIEKIFIIYPLEAVGYEHSVRSPYLDMLNILKTRLMSELWVFVIGFSFRDPTIASIFEEVLRERIRINDWHPLGPKLEERAKEAKDTRLKLFLVDSNPREVMNNLEKQGFVNVQRACIPIEVNFPHVDSDRFAEEFSRVLTKIASKLLDTKIIEATVSKQINEDYQLNMSTVEEV